MSEIRFFLEYFLDTSFQNFISRRSHPFPSLYLSPYAKSQTADDPVRAVEFVFDRAKPYLQIRNLYFWQAQCLLWVKERAFQGQKTINFYESAHMLNEMQKCRFKTAGELLELKASLSHFRPNLQQAQSIDRMKNLATLAKKCNERAAQILREPIARGMVFHDYAKVIPICECNGIFSAEEAAHIMERAAQHMAMSFTNYAPKHRLGRS